MHRLENPTHDAILNLAKGTAQLWLETYIDYDTQKVIYFIFLFK
jgi:hypothetical protein